ncbi:MAG TPA: decaprenyl-phosphate phosphoribosyltransferase [Vicinamibacterales bacterium]|nr:decaprenyl-phosphate phosphoribosyltransferase [Vicinamibacterales bacterium]
MSGRPTFAGAPDRTLAANLIVSLRPGQWTKNLLVFAGVLFGQRLLDAAAVGRSLAAFVIFCALSGAVYLVNDVADREQDRLHPLKATRPIASGALPVPTAIAVALVLAAAAVAAAFVVSTPFGGVAVAYLALQALYSGPLKRIVILDVLTLAIGFVLRAVAGAVAVDVEISHWLLVCTLLLALFIALAKRRHEVVLLADDASSHRRILGEYSAYLLDQMIAVVTASTLIAYIFYTVSPETQAKFGTPWLGLTIPFPLYGIFRYLYLVHKREGGGSPADLLLTDRPLLVCVALWALAVALIIYRPV